jgi:benzoyl-CoA reductase/2-hydroxyglutaryl-CoA dehydratase subunit BcrC/BadD/HgdB
MGMSQGTRMVNDLFRSNFLKLTIKFYSGKNQLRLARKMHKKVISMILPVGIELALAVDAVPIFLGRVGDYSSQPFLRAARLYQNLVGWNLLSSGVRLLRPILGDRFFSEAIDQFLNTLYSTYEKYIAVAEKEGTPLDACFGTRLLLGATWPHLKDINGTIGYGTRCNWFSKVFEEIEEKSPMVLIEIPNTDSKSAEEMMIDSLNQAIAKLEQITGNTITNEKLRRQTMIANEIREAYLKILEIWSKDKIRLHPLTFTNILSLLHIGFADFLCEPKFYGQTLRLLTKDLQFLKNEAFDTTSMPKLILVNAFGGFEPRLPEIMDNLGGRVLIADWEVLRILNKIELDGSDMLKNYAHYLIGFESAWMDNTTLVDRYISLAAKYKIDGILFNSIYGCKSITPSLKLFKERLQEANLALVDIGFQNVGDNYEQLKTRIGAVLEIIRERKS